MTVKRITAITAVSTIMICGSLLFSAGASAAAPSYRVHYTLVNTSRPKLPRRIIILPVSIVVKEKSYGGVSEPVDAWSRQASRNIYKSLGRFAKRISKRKGRIRLVRRPNFTASEDARISEHIALYRQVVNTAISRTSVGQGRAPWKHKLKKFDYTIGPGLNFLRAKTSADTALFIYGEDTVSSSGRKVKAVVGNIPFFGALVGGPPQLGYSFVHVGLVDLRTGNLLWMNKAFKGSTGDLRKPAAADAIIKQVFKDYPGITKYRKAFVK